MSRVNSSERLILFTRYPEPGKTKTRLIPGLGPQGAADLQKRMTEHVMARTSSFISERRVDMEVRYEGGNRGMMEKWLGSHITYRSQGRGGLGTRMAQAFSQAFNQGKNRVVLIGSDCPGINEATVRAAFDLLGQFDLVLGPANDGGYYLIGLRQEETRLFDDVPWGTAAVIARTLESANQLGLRWVKVEPLDDVDRAKDIEVWEREAMRKEVSPHPAISIVIPTLNEEENLGAVLASTESNVDLEIIVVDGGSSDGTTGVAKSFGVRLLTTDAGRARQVNAGGLAARGDVLIFLHGDTRLPRGYEWHILDIMGKPGVVAGAFTLAIDGSEFGFRIIEMLANLRSRVFQMPYGDQGIFLRREVFRALGGFPDMVLMEDFVFMKGLRKRGKVAILPVAVKTSARRWRKLGILKTTLINQAILLGYFLGTNPERLARWYRRSKFRN
ncbi:MAG: TIGR04283 family arsenosugar biosynthesis glycosyltransferase [Deltaproteobacteria bacterium]|nr:TIGR04283 family arsenosugar biosynthesis glycosyltransferase [Deltaproteobacteria bacterium]